MSVLTVDGLSVSAGDVELVKDVSFEIGKGERVALVGESGCGKSVTALSIIGLLGNGYVAAAPSGSRAGTSSS